MHTKARLSIFLVLTLVFQMVFGAGLVKAESKKAFKLLEKQEFEKLEELLAKSLEKDSVNPGARYVYSLMFLTAKYPKYNIDTSYYFINTAIADYKLVDEKGKEDLQKLDINDSTLHLQQREVEKQAYRRARALHTINDYNYFMQIFKGAIQTDSAVVFRDEIAYQQAVQVNTYQAFQQFLHAYPEAQQHEQAIVMYDNLLYQAHTKDKKLESYIRFLKNNPNTPYRDEAEKQIFEISTADNSTDSYMTFIEQYPRSKMRKRAMDMLYHCYKAHSSALGFLNKFDILAEKDSLSQIARAETGTLFPIFEMNQYGFAKSTGEKLIDFSYAWIKKDYYCGNIKTDYLEVRQKEEKMIVSRLGDKIYAGAYDQVEDMGCGALKIKKDGFFGVVHKSGQPLLEFKYEDVGLVAEAFLKFKYNGKWGLTSFSHRAILPPQYDEIFSEGNFVIVEKSGLYAVQNVASLAKIANGNKPNLHFSYDDFELIYAGQLLLFKGDKETVMNLNLQEKIPLGAQNFYELYEGWMIKKDGKYKIYDQIFYPLSDLAFDKVEASKSRAAIKYGHKWGIYNDEKKFPETFNYDSVRFLSEQIGIIVKGDTTFALFDNDSLVDISYSKMTKLLLPSGLDPSDENKAAQYLLTKTPKGHFRIYNIYGIKILEGRFDAVEALGNEYLVVEKAGKRGLYFRNGKQALKLKYSAIGNYHDGYVSTLINGKFGIFNHQKGVFLSAKYQKALVPFGKFYFVGTKGKALGLVNLKNEDVTGYKFEEIRDWNDSVALVKQDEIWHLYDIKNDNYVYSGISEFKVLRDDDQEKILLITKDNHSGILSNVHGEVVGPTFNDIINIGSPEMPLYFAEKYIREAEFYVVIYYNAKGKILRKQIFTDVAEYEKIYCG